VRDFSADHDSDRLLLLVAEQLGSDDNAGIFFARAVERMAEDPRRHARVPWNRPGELSSLTGNFISNCFVRDISAGGARLVVPGADVVPDYFRLDYGVEGLRPKCRVRWRDGNEIGVQFYRSK
jgi:hypothetical protein